MPQKGSLNKDQLRNLLVSDNVFASSLIILAVDAFGPECLGDGSSEPWHPDTFRTEFAAHFDVSLPKPNLDKLMAAVSVLTNDAFFRSATAFIPLANAISGSGFNPQVFDPADSLECAWAITEMMLLCPPEENDPFSEEVCGYIAQILKEEGYVTPPDVLKIATGADISDKVRYDFSDDPEMFDAIYKAQASKTEEVEGIIRDTLDALVSQLVSLPLRTGNVEELLEQHRER